MTYSFGKAESEAAELLLTAQQPAMTAAPLKASSEAEELARTMAASSGAARIATPSSSKLPLYIGLGLAGLAVVGGIMYATRKKAPTPMVRNRARRVKRNSSFGPERDRVAAQAREAFGRGDGVAARRALARLSEIDLALMPRAMARNSIYAIPERRAYPIRTAQEAYHATQRLKQGRVSSETDAKRIITAIQRKHPDVWRKHLAGYPLAKIMASKRRGLEARYRS